MVVLIRNSIFLAFDYGLMYVLSFATFTTMFASVFALVLGLLMIVGRSVWRCFAKWESTRTEALAGKIGTAHSFGCLAQMNKSPLSSRRS